MTDVFRSPSPNKPPSGSAITAVGVAVLDQRRREALERRGLDPELMERLGVSASQKLAGDCIAIPFYFRGNQVNTKYRTLTGEKLFAQDKGGKQVLWNGDVLADHRLDGEALIITEGELDAISAIQAGYRRTVSVPGGAPPEESDGDGKRYECLDRDELQRCREIILAVDGDRAGGNLMHGLLLRLGRYRCKFLRYPPDCKDLNDVLQLMGPAGVQDVVRGAAWCKVDGLYRMADLPPVPNFMAYDVGMVGLVDHYRVRKGDLVVVTGRPGDGKTSFVNEVCCRMAWTRKWNTVFASFEQSPQRDHRRVLRSFHSKKLEREMTDVEKAEADAWINQRFSFIVPGEDDDVTLLWFLERAATAITQLGADIVVLDPWNEMDHTRPNDMTLTEYVGFAIKQLRKLAKKNGVHLIVVAHPAKMSRGKDGKFPVPSLYDISDSAHWYNKCDLGIIVSRQMGTNQAEIHIQKSRYETEIGRPGIITGMWDATTSRYTIMDGA